MRIGNPFTAFRHVRTSSFRSVIASSVSPFGPIRIATISSFWPVGRTTISSFWPIRSSSSVTALWWATAGLNATFSSLGLIFFPAFWCRKIIIVPAGTRRGVFYVDFGGWRLVPEFRRFPTIIWTSWTFAIFSNTAIVSSLARTFELGTFIPVSIILYLKLIYKYILEGTFLLCSTRKCTLEETWNFLCLSRSCLCCSLFLASSETPPVYVGVSSDVRKVFLSTLTWGFWNPSSSFLWSASSFKSWSNASFNLRFCSVLEKKTN